MNFKDRQKSTPPGFFLRWCPVCRKVVHTKQLTKENWHSPHFGGCDKPVEALPDDILNYIKNADYWREAFELEYHENQKIRKRVKALIQALKESLEYGTKTS